MQTGYRFFECEDCGTEWKTACRDVTSPSGEHCPNENGCEFQPIAVPHRYELQTLPTDNHGNLIHEHTELNDSPPAIPNVAILPLVRNYGITVGDNEFIANGTLVAIDSNGKASPAKLRDACYDIATQIAKENGNRNSEEFHCMVQEELKKLLSPLVHIPKYDLKATRLEDGMSISVQLQPEYAYSSRDSIRDRKAGLFPEPIGSHPIDIAVIEDTIALTTAKKGFGVVIFDYTESITAEVIVSEHIRLFHTLYGHRIGSPEYWNMLVKAKEAFDFDKVSEELTPLIVNVINDLSTVFRRRFKRLPVIQIDVLNDCCSIKLS